MAIDLSRLQVIVIDDNPHMRVLIRDLLFSFEIKTVLECEDGTSALDELKHFHADIAIVDWMMEPMDGITFTKHIRGDNQSPNPFLPIIMLTGHTERYRLTQARDSGVTEVLAKPVTALGLYARIQSVIEEPRQYIRNDTYLGPDRRRKVEKYSGEERRGKGAVDIEGEEESKDDENVVNTG